MEQHALTKLPQLSSYDEKVSSEPSNGVTAMMASSCERCFEYFNRRIFENLLHSVLITYHKKPHSFSYYKPAAWVQEDETKISEININPDLFWMDVKVPMVALVAAMAQQLNHNLVGGTIGYTDHRLSQILEKIGLPGRSGAGKTTGKKLLYQVTPGGLFDTAFNEMPADLVIPLKPLSGQPSRFRKKRSKVPKEEKAPKNRLKYTCLGCSMNVWGKPKLHVICGTCKTRLAVIDDFGKK